MVVVHKRWHSWHDELSVCQRAL